MSKDLKDIYISFSLFEGEKYTISDVDVIGDIPVSLSAYTKVVSALEGTTYSQSQITGIEEFFINLLRNQGYAFAEVSPSTDIDEDLNEVKITFNVMPGNRTYTRKILFSGNNTTQDYVLRREMRQFEGAWTSDQKIENSKIRLERLGYFKQVEVETIPVPLTDDQIDILYTVEEENTGSIGGNIGYSDFGLMLGFNLQEQNF